MNYMITRYPPEVVGLGGVSSGPAAACRSGAEARRTRLSSRTARCFFSFAIIVVAVSADTIVLESEQYSV